MENEDPGHKYADVKDTNGAGAISGINAASFPAQYKAIKSIPQAQRGSAVENFYLYNFWNGFFEQINSDEVAMRVFDMAFNTTSRKAWRLLQGAVNALHGAQIEEDGVPGPVTIAAVNNQISAMLVSAYQALRYAHYQDNDADNPALPVLLKRAASKSSKREVADFRQS